MSFLQLAWPSRKTAERSSSSSGATSDSASSSSSSQSRGAETTDDDNDTDTNASGFSDGKAEEIRKLKRRLQTEKARTQMQLNAQKRRRQKLAESDFPQHAADSYQADLTPETTLTNPGNYSKTQKLRRLRLLFSWFTSWITSVIGCFFPGKHKIRHVINICVVDDTNMRLAAPYKVTGKSRQSRIVSVINNLQTLVFNISPADEDLQPVLEAESSNAGSQTDICNRASYRSFTVHTPMVPLDASHKSVYIETLCFMSLNVIMTCFIILTILITSVMNISDQCQ